jgi:hypothetical protein
LPDDVGVQHPEEGNTVGGRLDAGDAADRRDQGLAMMRARAASSLRRWMIA